ncbi:MAG: hypothetical protein AAGC70_19815 [Pseudomonadota bacterium]
MIGSLTRRLARAFTRDFLCALVACVGMVALLNLGPGRDIPLPIIDVVGDVARYVVGVLGLSDAAGSAASLISSGHDVVNNAWPITGLALLFSAVLSTTLLLARVMAGSYAARERQIWRRR